MMFVCGGFMVMIFWLVVVIDGCFMDNVVFIFGCGVDVFCCNSK